MLALPLPLGILAPRAIAHPGDFTLITVILPAYNEEEALPPLLESLAHVRAAYRADLTVIVVDDGSADRTPRVVEAHAAKHGGWIRLVQHPHNMGLSQGIQTGFRAALEGAAPTDIVVTLDADNTQPAGLIPRMAQLIDEGHDVVIASRYRLGARVYGVPFMRRLYSLVMSLLFRAVFPIRGVRD